MKRVRLRWVVIGAIVAVGVAWFVSRRLRGTEVPAVIARKGPITQHVVVTGRVTPPAQIQLGSTIGGTVRAVTVDEGDSVQPGQPLIELDAAELEAAVRQAQAQVTQAKARLAQVLRVSAPAQAEALRQAELELAQVQRQAERSRMLADAGVVTPVQLEEAQTSLAQAQSRVDSARAQAAATRGGGADVRSAEAAVAQAEGQLAAAQARRAQATLSAPAEALVLRRDVEPGDWVSPARTLMVLARKGPTQLSVEPDERNLAFLEPGQKAQASADAFPDQRFAATVSTIAPAVDPDRGTVEVKLRVPSPPPYLRAEMTVSVEIEVASKPAGIVVPSAAVQDAATARPFVLVARDGKAARAEVKLGLTGEGRVELAQGVDEGATVLIPKGRLGPGTRVRPIIGDGARED